MELSAVLIFPARQAVVYALLPTCTATSLAFGYRMLLRLSRALSIGLTVLLVIGVVAYADDFSTAAPPARSTCSAASGRPGCSRRSRRSRRA